MGTKFEMIIESYINGNISWVKAQVKKLSKDQRKALYNYVANMNLLNTSEKSFFFSLI